MNKNLFFAFFFVFDFCFGAEKLEFQGKSITKMTKFLRGYLVEFEESLDSPKTKKMRVEMNSDGSMVFLTSSGSRCYQEIEYSDERQFASNKIEHAPLEGGKNAMDKLNELYQVYEKNKKK